MSAKRCVVSKKCSIESRFMAGGSTLKCDQTRYALRLSKGRRAGIYNTVLTYRTIPSLCRDYEDIVVVECHQVCSLVCLPRACTLYLCVIGLSPPVDGVHRRRIMWQLSSDNSVVSHLRCFEATCEERSQDLGSGCHCLQP